MGYYGGHRPSEGPILSYFNYILDEFNDKYGDGSCYLERAKQ